MPTFMYFFQVLRFSAKLDSPGDEDSDRSFILSYHVVDATMELKERVRKIRLSYITCSSFICPLPLV